MLDEQTRNEEYCSIRAGNEEESGANDIIRDASRGLVIHCARKSLSTEYWTAHAFGIQKAHTYVALRWAWIVQFTLGACGGTQPTPAGPDHRQVRELSELRLVADRDSSGNVNVDAYDAEVLFERGVIAAKKRDCENAQRLYLQVVQEFPGSRFSSSAIYNAALCWHKAKKFDAAIIRYQDLRRRYPDRVPDARHAHLQELLCLIESDSWSTALEVAAEILKRDDLTSNERLEVLAHRARAALGVGTQHFEILAKHRTATLSQDRADQAPGLPQEKKLAETLSSKLALTAAYARRAIGYARIRESEGEALEAAALASAHFSYAETLRLRQAALEIPNDSAPKQRQVFEQRAKLVLEAQRAYIHAVEVGSVTWSLASAYKIGAMYEDYYNAVMQAPVPPPPRRICKSWEKDSAACIAPALVPEYEAGFKRQVARLVKPLLQQAVAAWELTVLTAERTGSDSSWAAQAKRDVERARARLEQLERPEESKN